jgi:DNA-binding Xre family transcriptional regulator
MTHIGNPIITLAERFDMATKKEKKMARLARKTGLSRSTLYRLKRGVKNDTIEFSTYGKLARFVLEESE